MFLEEAILVPNIFKPLDFYNSLNLLAYPRMSEFMFIGEVSNLLP